MYYRYFGLSEAPFSIAVNPRYLFMSARHRDALAHLLYGVGEGGGFVLLTGEVGTGKTTIIRSLLEQLPDHTDLALVFNPALEADELLASVCDELGIAYDPRNPSRKQLTDLLHRFLLDNHSKGRNTVLLIDEAQHLKFEVLEQIRLLTNLETNTKKLLQIILVGQPELRDLLNRPELRQLAQRITARYQLKPLNLQETDDYIRHRLQVAGLPANQTLFPKSVVKALHRASRGVPRIINVLCDRMLLGTYGKNKTMVDKAMFRQAVAEVAGEEQDVNLQSSAYRPALLGVLAAVALGLAGWLAWQQLPASNALHDSPALVATTPAAEVVPVPAEPALVQPSSKPASPWIRTEELALSELLLSIHAGENAIASCDPQQQQNWRCETLNLQTWQELATYNRPAVLKLITKARLLRYAVLLGFDQDVAFVSVDGHQQEIPITTLGELWTGDAMLFWQPHPQFTGPLMLGDRGPMVSWLAQQFAELDQQPGTLTDDTFNAPLQQRVILFQQAHALKADGVVGLKTLLKLQEQVADPVTLIQARPEPAGELSAMTIDEG